MLRMWNPDDADDVYEIETLRPLEWILEHGAFAGEVIEFETERSPVDLAYVVAVERAPRIKRGPGRVVLSTFKHRDDLLQVRFADTAAPILVAPSHKLFSESREEWLKASALAVGETVRAGSTYLKVLSIEPVKRDKLFDIEVETDHSYFVGSSRVLSHNCGVPQYRGGTGSEYDKVQGQGLYVLLDPGSQTVKYVGRGDAPSRIEVHALSKDEKRFMRGRILFENNLTAPQARGLEQMLMDHFGGARSVNLMTDLLNKIRSFSPRNPKAPLYRNAVTPELWHETIRRINAAR